MKQQAREKLRISKSYKKNPQNGRKGYDLFPANKKSKSIIVKAHQDKPIKNSKNPNFGHMSHLDSRKSFVNRLKSQSSMYASRRSSMPYIQPPRYTEQGIEIEIENIDDEYSHPEVHDYTTPQNRSNYTNKARFAVKK